MLHHKNGRHHQHQPDQMGEMPQPLFPSLFPSVEVRLLVGELGHLCHLLPDPA